jgi:hypothetical protein
MYNGPGSRDFSALAHFFTHIYHFNIGYGTHADPDIINTYPAHNKDYRNVPIIGQVLNFLLLFRQENNCFNYFSLYLKFVRPSVLAINTLKFVDFNLLVSFFFNLLHVR